MLETCIYLYLLSVADGAGDGCVHPVRARPHQEASAEGRGG